MRGSSSARGKVASLFSDPTLDGQCSIWLSRFRASTVGSVAKEAVWTVVEYAADVVSGRADDSSDGDEGRDGADDRPRGLTVTHRVSSESISRTSSQSRTGVEVGPRPVARIEDATVSMWVGHLSWRHDR